MPRAARETQRLIRKQSPVLSQLMEKGRYYPIGGTSVLKCLKIIGHYCGLQSCRQWNVTKFWFPWGKLSWSPEHLTISKRRGSIVPRLILCLPGASRGSDAKQISLSSSLAMFSRAPKTWGVRKTGTTFSLPLHRGSRCQKRSKRSEGASIAEHLAVLRAGAESLPWKSGCCCS